jgi:Bacterial toxin 46
MHQRDYWRSVAKNFYTVYFPDRLGELDYIDYNYPVRDVQLEKGTRLWGFKDPRVSPFMTTFFCPTGTPREILGVHGAGNLKSNPRVLPKVLNEYHVMMTIPHALLSLCAPGVDKWSERGRLYDVLGGGWQYKIPQPARYMIYTTPFPQR